MYNKSLKQAMIRRYITIHDISIQFHSVSIHRYRLKTIWYTIYRYIVASLIHVVVNLLWSITPELCHVRAEWGSNILVYHLLLMKFVYCNREFPICCLNVLYTIESFETKYNHKAITCHLAVVITAAGYREVPIVNLWVRIM